MGKLLGLLALSAGLCLAQPPQTEPSPSSQSRAADHCQTAPALLHQEEPEYTQKARRAKVQGTVVLHFEVDATGHAVNVQLVRGLGFGLDEKAIKALRKSKFRPGYIDGKPVSCTLAEDFTFRLL